MQGCRRSGKEKILQVQGKFRELYFESGKIDTFKEKSGKIEII